MLSSSGSGEQARGALLDQNPDQIVEAGPVGWLKTPDGEDSRKPGEVREEIGFKAELERPKSWSKLRALRSQGVLEPV